jgi:outer membrane protein assembly factor BamA
VDTQFVIGSTYNFNYNQMLNTPQFASGLYFNGLLDLSGNVAGLLTGADVNNGKRVNLFGTPFSQYIKTELDTRYYLGISPNSQWANRLIIGFGYPYGNSRLLPFVKQFFIGGNNSLRGFRSRSVGPGTSPRSKEPSTKQGTFFPDMTGDIKLEINTEYRRRIAGIIHGAVFFDAGNIWLFNEDINQPGGKFTANFIKELAMDAGIGLRIDITILLLRLDVAAPLRKPWLPADQRKLKFGTNELIYNLAIGLPF